ncbi:hypothetical protein GCM10010171_22080 [Actinokineospora fastidiosa]|uniref:Uncharacterized protein n=1 Tax=Actinokineospora fastidiosa TaxID=1816 RepID=A0A918LC72_9PSEU|nr:hypothetical protein GCM10010171_22080 [Actinokineospora fastidiosa]
MNRPRYRPAFLALLVIVVLASARRSEDPDGASVGEVLSVVVTALDLPLLVRAATRLLPGKAG